MQLIDWLIVLGMLALITTSALRSRKYAKSPADFLAANRCAGRYLLCQSEHVATMGAISLIAAMEMYHVSGFTPLWWPLFGVIVALVVKLSGWMIYRYRETRALTIAQFYEVRYSHKFRIFAGILAFTSGVINFGLFPAIGTHFFIRYCGLPLEFELGPVTLPSYGLIMFILLTMAVLFTTLGGHVTVIVTDFLQGAFCSVAFLLVAAFALLAVDWSIIVETLGTAPEGKSMLHPFKIGESDFNIWFFLIMSYGAFYNRLSWQGNQAYNSSASNPHEAKMAGIIALWNGWAGTVVIVMLPVVAFTIMTHSDFAALAGPIGEELALIDNEYLKKQMTALVAARYFLPTGVVGLLCAVMAAAFISTHDTYMHSWGSILVQDVIMPLRKKPLSNRQHFWLLRLAIIFVAVFAFFFALLYKQTEHIYMFFAITGAIYLGGAGIVIMGGLYWKRGTTTAAWWSLIIGSAMATVTITIKQLPEYVLPDSNAFLAFLSASYMWIRETSSQIISFMIMMTATVIYIVVSLCGRKVFNLDKMLHRGKYAVEEDRVEVSSQPSQGGVVAKIHRVLGITYEFTFWDKVIYYGSIVWNVGWSLAVVVSVIVHDFRNASDQAWATFWQYYMWMTFAMGVITVIWIQVGGFKNLFEMLARLRTMRRDDTDDGRAESL